MLAVGWKKGTRNKHFVKAIPWHGTKARRVKTVTTVEIAVRKEGNILKPLAKIIAADIASTVKCGSKQRGPGDRKLFVQDKAIGPFRLAQLRS